MADPFSLGSGRREGDVLGPAGAPRGEGPRDTIFSYTVRIGTQEFRMPEESDEAQAYQESLEQATGAPVEVERVDESDTTQPQDDITGELAKLGITLGQIDFDVRDMAAKSGIDPDNPELQALFDDLQAQFDDPSLQAQAQTTWFQIAPALAQNPDYQIPAETSYDQALELAGFTTEPLGKPEHLRAEMLQRGEGKVEAGLAGTLSDTLSSAAGTMQTAAASLTGMDPRFERNPETGWTRHRNGTLVSPDGEVAFDPTSTAPGSPTWQRTVVGTWSAEKVAEWKSRLADYGYLSKDQAKGTTADLTFLEALSNYHVNRYRYGKAVPVDEAAAAGGAPGVKPVDMRDMQATLRNDVREQYRRIFGTDPSEGEVETWTNYVIKTGMSLQRKFIGKYDSPNYETASMEARERMVEQLEQSPEGQFVSGSIEENTRLRDTFERMAVVTNSLAS